MQKHLINTLLVIFGLLLGLICAEFAVQLILPQNRMVTWIEMHPKGFMMNQSGGTAFQEFGDREVQYRFTENRLRGSHTDTSSKTILALGDSFTFGLLLKEEDTFIYQLQNQMDLVQILNGGVGGAGLADWPVWLETFGPEIKPDVILYFLNTQDIDRALSKNIYVLKGDSLHKTQRWKPRKFMTKLSQKGWYRWLQAHSDLVNLAVRVLWKNWYFTDHTNNFNQESSSVPIPDNEDLQLTSSYSLNLSTSILQKLNKWCEENNCRLIITTTGFFENEMEPNYTRKFYNWLKKNEPTEFLFFDNTECVDSAVAGNFEAIKIPNDGHPNEKGAALIAECTMQWLEPEIK